MRFDANVAPGLPLDFRGEKVVIEIRLGENTVDFYRARNTSAQTMVGVAKFNVTPLRAAKYFNKIKCFCEDGQELEALAVGPLRRCLFHRSGNRDGPRHQRHQDGHAVLHVLSG
ncbi:MAG: cytochrome c oxidase assembly protein [Rhodopseudomonas palustris]|nr:cytochrome c oxidase assembly protein [Rhodopseudomonas palustris]